MKITFRDSKAEFLGSVNTDYISAITQIEKAGRTCYKSENKGGLDNAELFVKKLIKSKHLAMVEHSNFVARVGIIGSGPNGMLNQITRQAGRYLTVTHDKKYLYVGGNLTAWYYNIMSRDPEDPRNFQYYNFHRPFIREYGGLFDLPELTDKFKTYTTWEQCPDNEIPHTLQRFTAKIICDRGVSHEIVRHRPCSFAQESTRYVNYGNRGMVFINPADLKNWSKINKLILKGSCWLSALAYNLILKFGMKPQYARAVLPNALKTEIIVTADVEEWKHIQKLRCHGSAHPDIQKIMYELKYHMREVISYE